MKYQSPWYNASHPDTCKQCQSLKKGNVMKLIVIDSVKQEVREETVTGESLKAMQDAVGGHIEIAYHFENGDTMFCDEEGLYKGHDTFVWLEGAHQPFAGSCVIAGCDDEGNTTSAKTSVEEVKRRVQFLSTFEVRAMAERGYFG